MNTFPLVITVAALAAAGAAPAWWATRDPVRWPFLVLPAGLLVCAAAAALTLMFPGLPFLGWWLIAAVAAAAASLRSGAASLRSGGSRWPGNGSRWPGKGTAHPNRPTSISPVLPALAVSVVGALTLAEMHAYRVITDARDIWFLHARMILGGHDVMVSALKHPWLAFSHPDYPEGASAAVALGWTLNSGHSYRLAQLVIGVLTAAATTAFGAELARLGKHGRGLLLSTTIGAGVVLACSAPFAQWASSGVVDPLWSACAVAAVVAGLIAPVSESSRRTALLLAAAGGVIKNDGIPIGIVIALLVLARHRLAEGRHRLAGGKGPRELIRPGRDVLGLIGAFTPLILWQVAISRHGIHNREHYLSNVVTLLQGDHTLTDRFAPFWSALWAHLPRWEWIAAAVILAPIVASRRRSQVGLGAQAWSLALVPFEIAMLVFAYLFDPGGIHWLIDTSIARTTIFLNLLGLALLAAWPITYSRPVPRTAEPIPRGTYEAVDTCAHL